MLEEASVAILGLTAFFMGPQNIQATGNLEILTHSGGFIGNRVWDDRQVPVPWHFNDPAVGAPPCMYSSTTAPVGSLLAQTTTSFGVWTAVVGSTMAVTYGGTTPVRNVALDGVNLVTYCSDTTFAPGVLASTPSFALAVDSTLTVGGGCPAGQGLLLGVSCAPAGFYKAGTLVDAQVDVNTSSPSKKPKTFPPNLNRKLPKGRRSAPLSLQKT